MKRLLFRTHVLAAVALMAPLGLNTASAVQIDFTGGNVVRTAPLTPVTTNNSNTWSDVDYYEEDGFKLDFVGGPGYIGNYYGAGNDVIHAHWLAGGLGTVTQIKVTKIDGSLFDLNYFVLTSNTMVGGGSANGTELAYIHASTDGTTSAFSQKLPSENWGFPATQVFLGSQFDNVKAFWFDVANGVDCFGMDNFYINEAAPPDPSVPLPAAAWAGLTLLGVMGGIKSLKRFRRSEA